MTKKDVREKLDFAKRRLNNLLSLIKGKRFGSRPHLRQQLAQEFFFHLIGAADVLAQFVNEKRQIGIHSVNVNISNVAQKLKSSDPQLALAIGNLYVNVRTRPFPAKPYSANGYLFRAYNYRHQVTHRGRNPFNFKLGGRPQVSFRLDPRDPRSPLSDKGVEVEMRQMLSLFRKRCESALARC